MLLKMVGEYGPRKPKARYSSGGTEVFVGLVMYSDDDNNIKREC